MASENSSDSTVVVAILSFAIAVAGVALFWLHLNKKERDAINRGMFGFDPKKGEITEAEQKLLQNKKKREKKKRSKANQKARRAEELAAELVAAATSPKEVTAPEEPLPTKPSTPTPEVNGAPDSPTTLEEVPKPASPPKKSKKSKATDKDTAAAEAKARSEAEEERKQRQKEEEEQAEKEKEMEIERQKKLEMERIKKEEEEAAAAAAAAEAEEQRKREVAELEAKRLAEREEQERIKAERIRVMEEKAAETLRKEQTADRQAIEGSESKARTVTIKERESSVYKLASTFSEAALKINLKQAVDKEDSLRGDVKKEQQKSFDAIHTQHNKELEACQPPPPPSPPSPPSGPVQRIPTPPPNPPPDADLPPTEVPNYKSRHTYPTSQKNHIEISTVIRSGTKLDIDVAWVDNSIMIVDGPRDDFGKELGLQRGMTLGSIDGAVPTDKDLQRISRESDKNMTLVFNSPGGGAPAPPSYPPPPVAPTPPVEPPPTSVPKHHVSQTAAPAVEAHLPLIPMCENDGVCAHINDPTHQKMFRHTCLIEGCEHASEPWHTRYFDHAPPRVEPRKRPDSEWKGQIEVVDTAKDEQLMLNGNWAKIKVRKLKESIAEKWKIAPSLQTLTTKSGVKLENMNSVCKDYEIKEGCIIYVEYPQQKNQHQHHQLGQQQFTRRNELQHQLQHQQQQLPFIPQSAASPNNLPSSMFYPAAAAAQSVLPTTVQLPQSQFMPQFNVAAATTYAQAPVSPNYMMQMKQMQQVRPPDTMPPNQWASHVVTDAYHYS